MDMQWLDTFLQQPEFQGMGHGQSLPDQNLGLGWVYYALCRALRPQHVFCIGSYRGFVPILFARGLRDNAQGGTVTFIDPSFVDDFWQDAAAVQQHFERYGAAQIQHHCMTTQAFVLTEQYQSLKPVDFLFVDGFHSAEQAQFDHEALMPKLSPNHLVFFHDSLSDNISAIYGEDHRYQYSVFEYINQLKQSGRYQVLDLAVEHGLSIVRHIPNNAIGH